IAQALSGLGSYKGNSDGYIVKINTLSSGVPSLVYSSYVGGGNFDQLTGVAVAGCSAFASGFTQSTDFPTVPSTVVNPPQGVLVKVTDTNPSLSIAKAHVGDFTQGQNGATYSITVSNVGCGPTSGTITVTDNVPTGLTLASMTGTGWTCNSNSCNRSDAL